MALDDWSLSQNRHVGESSTGTVRINQQAVLTESAETRSQLCYFRHAKLSKWQLCLQSNTRCRCRFGGSECIIQDERPVVQSIMSALDSRDRELLEYLHRTGGADIQSLCDLLKITRTAVRSRLERLTHANLLESESRSVGRGRPKQVYAITANGLHALGEDYRELAVVFWQAIAEVDDSDLRQALLAKIRDRLADRFRQKLASCHTVEQRMDQLASEMHSSGFNIESDHSSALPILRETNCPFPMLADVDETICEVEKEVLEQVLGTKVEFLNRCRDGHHCCEFEVQTAAT
jgi:predicted ArsR family transcriptional regulator